MSLKQISFSAFGVLVALLVHILPAYAECSAFSGGDVCGQCLEAYGSIEVCSNGDPGVTVSTCCSAPMNQQTTGVPIIQPLDDATSSIAVDTTSPQGTFINYVDIGLSWLLTVAVGIVSLWVVLNGILIVVSVDQRREAYERIMWAIAGLVVLVFFGTILRFLNSNFFVAS